MTTLDYLFDPLCGWCYAAAPLIAAARTVPGLAIVLHGGGMLAGPARRTVTPDWHSYVAPHDARIAQMSGQVFGPAYTNGLLHDIGAPLDSGPPTTAILAAESLGGRGLDMLARQQQAHYVEGRRIAEPAVLADLAADIGLDADAYARAVAALDGAATAAHIAESRRLLQAVGGQGFPTVLLTLPDGRRGRVEPGGWLGRPAAFRDELAGLLGTA